MLLLKSLEKYEGSGSSKITCLNIAGRVPWDSKRDCVHDDRDLCSCHDCMDILWPIGEYKDKWPGYDGLIVSNYLKLLMYILETKKFKKT